MITTIITIVVFFIILSILVFVHELGHYTVARLIGVHVEEFGFGLPPRIWGKKIGKTIYSINWLPIGGFVKLSGEDDDPPSAKASAGKGSSKQTLSQYFWARSKTERVAILLAGVTMNFLLAVGITTYLLTQGVYETTGQVHIERVVAGSPAAAAGIKQNDIITRVTYSPLGVSGETKSVIVPSDLVTFTHAHEGESITFTIVRNSSTFPVSLVPRKTFPAGEGPMGVAVSDLEFKTYPLSRAPWVAVKQNVARAGDMFTGIWGLIVKVAQLKPVGADVAGPIGIAQVTGQAVKFGFRAVLEFMSLLSLNLAVLNVLPIPALDGGRVLFVFLEKILGRKIAPAFERSTHQIGMLILLALVVLISIHDILRLAQGG
ncbi:MAG TPA: site-2 protease family protein [Patescibacteria group bacterium]|nr:site-2 protease family protein [Patescibacteria group bacterium]